MPPIRILILGDIVAKLGRKTAAAILPSWREQYKPDAVIANIENLAHGKGITRRSLEELAAVGITVATGGNHIWGKGDPATDELRELIPIALPANDSRAASPLRWQQFTVGKAKIVVLNLLGQVEMGQEIVENPFLSFDKLYESMGKPKFLLVDFHAEATSEKVALGHYLNGRASVVYGTHTHVPTADARILSNGTGYITDIGMTGSDDSVLGVSKEVIIQRFLGTAKNSFDYPESGAAWANAILCELDAMTGRCLHIDLLSTKLTIN